MKDHGQMTTHNFSAFEEDLLLPFIVRALAGDKPVNLLPHNGSSFRQPAEPSKMQFCGYITAAKQLPVVDGCNMVEVPAASGRFSATNDTPHGNPAAL